MYPTDFDSQYHQQFTDTLHLPNYRRHSTDAFGLAEDPLNFSYQSYDYSDTQAQLQLHAPVPVQVPYGPPQVANSSRQITPPYTAYYDNHVAYPPSVTPAADTNILDYYANAPQMLFPTPSELLTDLSTPTAQISATSLPTQREQSQTSERSIEAPVSTPPNTSKTESQRKARQRAVAEEIGFIPTDP
jgi:hypothetical protein